jgi:hypothetical protein
VEPHEIAEIRRQVNEGVREGVRKALLRHKKAGQSVSVWRDGRVVMIPPEQIPVEDELPEVQR